MRALEKRMGLSTNRATSPAMWRPTGASGVRGRSGGGPARGKKGGEELGHDAWVPREAVGEAGGGLWPPSAAGGGAQRRRQRETEKQRGGR